VHCSLMVDWQWHVYCLLFAEDSWSKENDNVSKKQNYWRNCEIPTKGRIGYRKHCHGSDDHWGRHVNGYHYDYQTEFEYQCKNSNPEYVWWGICKWLGTESCKSFRN